jgi:hypothetical protein
MFELLRGQRAVGVYVSDDERECFRTAVEWGGMKREGKSAFANHTWAFSVRDLESDH